MILRLFFVILAVSGLFVLSLMMSYEILQITPSARSQQFLIQYFIPTIESSCKEMDKTLNDHNYSTEHIIRAINDGKLYSLDLSSKDIDSITTCLKGTLPEIGSYPISEKIGFIESIDNHKVKGKANVITIEKTNYLRIENFEISYGTKNDDGFFTLPELHLYLIPYDQISANLNLDTISEKDYLDQLHVNLGSKNYKLPSDKYLSEYDGILIYDEIHKVPYAKIKLEHADYLRDGFNNFFNNLVTVDSPKFESKIVYERNGFLEGIGNYHAKGTVILDYSEDEGELKFEQFEISKGADLGIYLTKDGDVGKSGYWIFDDTGNVYVSSTNTDQVLRYSSDGTFKDVFVETNSGGLDGPKDLIFDDNNNLYVSSTNTDQVLRYSSDGTFKDVFVETNSGGLDGPRDLVFNDNNLYVSTLDEVFRFDKFGKFKDIFITSGKGGLDSPNGLVFDDNNNLYVSSTNTDQVLRYSSDGTFKDVFVETNSGGLDGPKDLMFSSDNNFLYVTSFLTNEVLRYDKEGVFRGDLISSRNGNIVSPEHGAFDSDNNLYVSTLDEVFRFDKFGKFKDIFITSGKGGLDSPNGLVFDDNNNLYVSSTNTDQVLRYSSDGTFKDVFVETNSGGLDGPKDLIFDDNNNLYVSSTNTDQVLRYSSDGTFDGIFVTSDYIKNPQGLTFDSNGNLYVVSTTTDELLRFDSNGEFIEVFASGGGLDFPTDVSSDGNFFYVSSTNTDQVLRYSSDGKFKDVFVTSDDITNPQGLLFNTNKDTLYVFSSDTNEVIKTSTENNIHPEKFITDASSALYQPKQLGLYDAKLCVSSYLTNDIQCYDEKTGENSMKLVVSFNRGLIAKDHSVVGPDGELYVSDKFRNQIHRYDGTTGIFSEIIIKTGDDLLQEPSYLSFDNEGENLYVSSDDKIFKFDGEEGNFIHTFISKNTGLNNPKGLAFDENYLYVNSYDNSRILRYDLNGNFVDALIHRDNGLLEPTGIALDDNHLYVSSKNNKILKYDKHTGEFLDEIKTSSIPHGIILDNKNNILYASIYDTNEVHAYDLNTGQLSVLISDKDGLEGPEGLAFDGKNYLYVSSSQNNTVFVYNLDTKIISPISVEDGDGILLKPIGLVMQDDFLYISNSGNDGILQYDPVQNTLNDFVKDTRDLMRPGEITFGPDGDLFVINENDNGIYRYNIDDGSIKIFTTSFFSTIKHESKNNMRDIIFNKDHTRLFATVPTENKILYFDKFGVLEGEFKNPVLEYPTNLAVSPDGKYIWVVNYGKNTLVSFNMDDGILDKTITPGEDGLTRIKDVRFGQDGNMYVMGGDYDQVLKYNITDGNYLGIFNNGGNYLGKLRENAIIDRYFVNEIDTKQNNIVMIYDHLLERPYSKVILNETIDLLTPINVGLNSLISSLRDSQEPKLQSTGFTKNTGFFVSAERTENAEFFNFLFEPNHAVYGQAIIKNIDHASIITIESFFIDYDKNLYVSTEDSNSIFTNGPNLVACLIKSGYHPTCNSNNSIELGKLDVNAGDNRFVVNNVDFDDYDRIVVYDTTFEKSLAFIPLQDYGILRISGESFLDWLQYELLVIPLLFVSVMLFPIVFDYSRGLFKIFFFIGYLFKERNTKKVKYFSTDKKVSILIPAHNEEYGIKKSIETALASTYPNKEVIVIDDGSTDDTYIIANSFAEKGLIKLIHHDVASGSKATALNYGVNYATGDYVLCMDGDTQLDKYALENTARFFNDDDISAFSGNVSILSGDDGVVNLLTKLQTYEYSIAIGLGRRFTSVFGILLVISGAFGIFKTDVMKSVHGFEHKTMTEDFDLTLKVKKTKKKIKFVPDSVANTYCPNNWTAWINQRNRWAYGQFQTLLRHKNLLLSFNTFKRRDQVAFSDLLLLDMFLVLFFPIGLTALGLISIALVLGDNLHVVVYPLTFVMCVFMIFEFAIFVLATIFSRKYSNLKLLWLVPIMTFFYRPYLKMITLRAYFRAFFKRQTSW